MPTLPTLYPVAPDGTATTMAAPVGAATHAEAMRTNDGDTSYSTSGIDSAGSIFVNLDDTPADFGTMDTLIVSCVVRLNGTRADDTTALYAQVFAADEVTALTTEVFVTDHLTGNTYTVDSTSLGLSSAGLNGDKATWDGAKLRLRWVYTKTAKSDGIALWVTQTYLDGTYGALIVTVTGAMAATATAQQTVSGGVVSYGSLAITGEATSAVTMPPEPTAGPMQIGMLFNEEFYYGAQGPVTISGQVAAQGTGTVTAASTTGTTGSTTMTATAGVAATSVSIVTGSLAIASTASYLVVGEAEKIATVSAAATSTTTAAGAGNTYATATLASDSTTTAAGQGVASGTIGMVANASTTSASSVETTGSATISSTASTATVAFQEKFGTLLAQATGTQTVGGAAATTGGAVAASDSTLAATGQATTTTTAALAANATLTVGSTTLATPTGLTATPTSPTEVTLDWSDVVDATSYDVERNSVVIARVTASTYVDSGLTPETSYTYRVRSVKVS